MSGSAVRSRPGAPRTPSASCRSTMAPGWARRRTQVLGLDRPEHAPLPVASERAEHRRVDHAPGRAEVTEGPARGIGEKAMGAADLGLGASGSAEPQAPVGPAVTADLVIGRRDPAHGLGRPRRTLTDQEEGGTNLAPGQELEDPLAPDRIRAVVEDERDAAARRRAAPDA